MSWHIPYTGTRNCCYKEIKRSVYTTVSQTCSDNSLLIRTDHGTKQENFLQMWRRSPQRFIVSVLYFVVVDRGAVFENGFDKQENRDERTANFQSREPRRDRITAANRAQKRYGNSRK